MFRPVTRFSALNVVLTICIVLAGPAARASPHDAPSLIDTIMLWLVANFDIDATAILPTLGSLPDAELVAMRYGESTPVRPE